MTGPRGIAALLLLGLLPECGGDETLTGYGAAGTIWHLREIDGTAFPASATIGFPREGRFEGTGPCNRYSGRQTAPYPWFRVEGLTATRRACGDLPAETRYLAALAAMTLAEVAGDTLILSDGTGREMIFRAEP